MKRSSFSMPSPAMVVSIVALLVALGGTSYAAVTLPKNSVGTAQLKKNAVISSKVKNGSLKAADFAAGQLKAGPKGDTGTTGTTGATGARGDTGLQGNPGPAGPTAAAKASKNFAPDVLLGPSSGTNVIDFDTTFAGAARLHMTFSGRVVASASLQVHHESGSAQTVDCNIVRMNSTNTGIAEAGQSEWQTLPVGAYSLMSLNAAFDLPAGDYNLRLNCSQIGGSANDVSVDDATLTAIAAAN